jgi:hypothetical protein
MNTFFQKVFNRASGSPPVHSAPHSGAGIGNSIPKVNPVGDLSPSDRTELAIGQPANKNGRPYSEFSSVPITEAIVRAITAEAEAADGLGSERNALAEIVAQMVPVRDFQLHHTPDCALKDSAKHTAEMQNALRTGDFAAASGERASWSEQDFLRHYKVKCDQAYHALCGLSEKARPIYERIEKKLSAAAARIAARMEVEERAAAIRWGVKFIPSQQLIAFGQAQWRMRQFIPVAGTSDPPEKLLKLISP